MTATTILCPYCEQPAPCDNDCGELRHIYREQQREKLADIDLDEIQCAWCSKSLAECDTDPCYSRRQERIDELLDRILEDEDAMQHEPENGDG